MTTTTKTTINTTIKVMITPKLVKLTKITIKINNMIKITIKDMQMKALKLSKHILIQISWSQDMMLHDLPIFLIKRSQDVQSTSTSILWLSCTTLLQNSKIWFTTKLRPTNSQRTQEPSRPNQWRRLSKRAKNPRLKQFSLQPQEQQASQRKPILSQIQ